MKTFLTSTFFTPALAITLLAGSASASLAQSAFFANKSSKHAFTGKAAPAGNHYKINALVSRPGASQDFIASGPNTWQHESNSIYTYDAQGRLTMRQYSDPATNQNTAREITVYDANGNETEFRGEQFNGTSWDVAFGYKQTYTYNAQNQKTEVIIQQWNSSNAQWEKEMREETAYNASNQITSITNSEWDTTTNSWVFVDRMNLSHTNGTATSLVVQEFDGAIWENVLRAQNVVWQVLYEIPSAYEMQFYDNGIWVNGEKYNAVYDANGGHAGIYQEWDFFSNTWINTYRETESYDINKNYTGWQEETWDPITTSWLYEGEEREVLTYNGIDITQRLFQDSWNANSILQDTRKEVYSNFQTFNISGIKNKLTEVAVNVYPNPATDQLFISIPEHKGGIEATLTDVTGRICLAKKFKTGEEKQLNIEALPKGVYQLQLQTEVGSTVKRIVKQ